jgi:hypothetical protein
MRSAWRYVLATSAAALVGVASILAAGTATATQEDMFNRFFANVLDGRPCYARTYDETYLKAHEAQRVQSIEIDLSRTTTGGAPNTADRFELGFALLLKTSPEWYGQAASCRTTEAGFDCFLEGDGGLFKLTPIEGGGLRLETGETGIALEGSDTVELSGKGGIDRVFELVPSREECDAANAFFESGGE